MRKNNRLLHYLKVLFVVIGCCSSSSIIAARPQHISSGISVKAERVSLQQVIHSIEQQSGFDFLYNNQLVNQYEQVDVNITNASLEEALNDCFESTNITYELSGKMVILQRKHQTEEKKEMKRVAGTVVDQDGEALPGVTIILVGSSLGTVTDIDGNFELSYPFNDNVSIAISFIGMKKETIMLISGGKQLITSETNLKIKLKEEQHTMSEVVVTGYANINKSSFTGSATTVTKRQLQKASPKSVVNALQIFDPSFRLTPNFEAGSNPNALPEMSVRGQSGIGIGELDQISSTSLNNNPNLPTYILDGFEVSVEKVYDLDVNRIESMTLLKDAAATAMYGSRAANGVVVITTVAPKAGEINVSYSMDLGLSTPDLSYYNLMDAEQKLETELLAGLYTSDDPNRQNVLDDIYNRKLQNIEMGVNTDWMSLPLRTGFSHKHSLFVEGGENSLRYGLDLMYDKNNGVMKGSSREKMSFGLKLQYAMNNIQVMNYVSFDNIKGKESPFGLFSDFVTMNPYDRYLDDNGNISKDMISWEGKPERNPMYDSTLGNYDDTYTKEFRDNLEMRWVITPDFNFKASASLFYNIEEGEKFRNPESTYFVDRKDKGDLRINERKTYGYDINTLFYYNGRIQDNHFLNVSAGFNFKETNSKSEYYNYINFPEGNFSSPEYAESLSSKPLIDSEVMRLMGALMMMNYTYRNIYLFDFSGRIDGSSQFGANKKYAPFASGGVGLNIHNYDFMRDKSPWIDQLKLRASYGKTGKEDFPSYTAEHRFNFMTDKWYTTGHAATLNYLGNPDLKWETTSTLDMGFELSLLNELLYLKGNYYIKKTDDLIQTMQLPSSSGFTSYTENVGQAENRGIEFNLRSKIIGTKSTQLYLFANGTHNKNRITKLSNAMKAYNDRVNEHFLTDPWLKSTPMMEYHEGASLTAIYGVPSLGIDPMTGKELFQYADGTTGYEWIPTEKQMLGDKEPKITGSFGTNFNYKGFTIDAYFRYEMGGQLYNQTLVDKVERANPAYNCDIRVLEDRWTTRGQEATYKSLSAWREATNPSSRFVQDYNWLSLSSLSVGYEFSQTMLRKWNLSRLRVQLNCNELFTVSTVKMEKGTAYPFARGYNLSVSATF